MRQLPTLFLAFLAIGLLTVEVIAVVTVAQLLSPPPVDDHWVAASTVLVWCNAPYLAAHSASVAFANRFPVSSWILAVTAIVAAALSLWFRVCDLVVASQAFEAKLAGMTYMNCGPPGRLVAIVLDYGLLSVAGGLAAAVAIGQQMLQSSPKTKLPQPHSGSKFGPG
jgi:hypothetical protein